MPSVNNWLVQLELKNVAPDLDAQDVTVLVQDVLGMGRGTPGEVADIAVWKLAEPETALQEIKFVKLPKEDPT
jgi:hypothetical protein